MGYICAGLVILIIIIATVAIIVACIVGSGADAHLHVERGGDE
jgi:hypothetical protein